jgi:hypothetical protein
MVRGGSDEHPDVMGIWAAVWRTLMRVCKLDLPTNSA